MSATITLILGGARSGKSRRAEQKAAETKRPVVYIATYSTAFGDPEMHQRIALHRATRPSHWTTIENEFNLDTIFVEHAGKTVLIDCLTLWLSYHCEQIPEAEILSRLKDSLQTARSQNITLFIVSNELGMGLIPESSLGRSFRDLCGRANQTVAALADHVEFQIAGLPLILKGGSL